MPPTIRSSPSGRPAESRRRACLVSSLAVASALPLLFTSAPAAAATLPGGLGPCLGPDCPTSPPDLGNGAIVGRDANVNIFVGGDFSIVAGAAEAEGRVVVMGDVSQNKSPAGLYNVGAVGVGAQVPPPEGSTFLAVRGNTEVPGGQTLSAIKPDPNGAGGDIRGVSRTGTGTVEAQEAVFDAAQAAETDPFVGLVDELALTSDCAARIEPGVPRPATGTISLSGTTWTFQGDGSSAIQIFNLTDDLEAPGGFTAGVSFTGIPAGATTIVNVVPGAAWTANVSFDGGGWQAIATRLLWNIPDPIDVAIGGPVQFYGSVLHGEPTSTTTVTASGLNGRVFITGDLVHGSAASSGGEEFHWYPFDGELPDCVTTATTTTTTTTTIAATTTIASTTTTTSTVAPTAPGATTTSSTLPGPTTTGVGAIGPTTTRPTTTRPITLPATGPAAGVTAAWALAVIAAGAILVVLARRRPAAD